MPVMADIEDDNLKLRFSIVSDYSKTNNPIRVKDKTFTFKTGSIGIQGEVDLDQYGEFYLQYGIGRSPSDEATIDHKINCYKEIAKYTYPKHKSQDIRVEEQKQPESIEIHFVSPDGTREKMQ